MSERELKKIRTRPPYETTPVPYERTKGEIEKLLKSYGVKGIRWTSMEGKDDVLDFIVNATIRGVKKQIGISVSPPHIFLRKRIRGRGMGHVENLNQEYRLLFHWIKSKVEAVVWGLSTIENEFLSKVVVSLPDGRSANVGEIVLGLVGEDRLQSLPFFGEEKRKQPQLEAKIVEVQQEEGEGAQK